MSLDVCAFLKDPAFITAHDVSSSELSPRRPSILQCAPLTRRFIETKLFAKEGQECV